MRISDWSSDVCSSDLQQLLQKFAGPCAGQIYRRHVGNIEHAGRLANGMLFGELGGVLDRHVPAGKVDELGAEADVFCVQSGFLERHDNSRFEGYDAIPGATAAPDRATSGHPWPARGSCLRAMLAKRHDPPLCPWT